MTGGAEFIWSHVQGRCALCQSFLHGDGLAEILLEGRICWIPDSCGALDGSPEFLFSGCRRTIVDERRGFAALQLPPTGGQHVSKYANITETVGNTPVVKINRLAPPDVNLYVKVEAFNPLGSVKDRLALGVIEEAERTGKLKPGQTVVEATSGNTGIGLAMVCAAKGYPLVVTMAETFSIERRKLMRFLGAKVI